MNRRPPLNSAANAVRTLIFFLVVFLGIVGCSSVEKRSQKLQLGMSQAAAIKVLGSRYTAVAARVEADGTPVSVLKFPDAENQDLFLYFRKDRLVQWGDTEILNAMPPSAPTEP